MNKININSKKKSRLATASLVCTIILPLFPIGFLLSFISLYILLKNKGKLKGFSNVVVAMILNICIILFLIFLVNPTAEARLERERVNTAIYNLKLLGKTIIKYSQDNNGYLPTSEKWCDVLMAYDNNLKKENFAHPKLKGSIIAYNKYLSGKLLADIHGNTILLFEAEGSWNISGGEELIGSVDPNRRCVEILYINQKLDGYWIQQKGVQSKHVKDLFRQKYITPQWKP